jgi:hypothetical protein
MHTILTGMRLHLRASLVVLTLAFSVGPLPAQAVPVGRLPILAPLGRTTATCVGNNPARDPGASNIARFFMVRDTGDRFVTLGVTAAAAPAVLTSMMITRRGRRGEGEAVTVSSGPASSVTRGMRRSFSTGTPAARSDDRRQGLFATDSAQSKALAQAVRRLCHG